MSRRSSGRWSSYRLITLRRTSRPFLDWPWDRSLVQSSWWRRAAGAGRGRAGPRSVLWRSPSRSAISPSDSSPPKRSATTARSSSESVCIARAQQVAIGDARRASSAATVATLTRSTARASAPRRRARSRMPVHRDRVEPGLLARAPAPAAARPQHALERVGDDVLGERAVAGLVGEEPEQAVGVLAVEALEGLAC